uniref:Translocator protein n=1 Tax=Rhabditophanes sp. KR3021 TaxID=114890 RepID=A0AC35TX28_9BILA
MVYVWTDCDTKKALASALVPVACTALTSYTAWHDKSVTNFLNDCCACKYAPTDPKIWAALDAIGLAPYGYASYLVFKSGGGFAYKDTTLALTLYGASLAAWLAYAPIMKKKDANCLFYNSMLFNVLSAGACYTFWQIDQTAGKLAIPAVLFAAAYNIMAYTGCQKPKTL